MASKFNQLSDLQQLIEFEFRSFANYVHMSDSLFTAQLRGAEEDSRKFQDSMSELQRENGGFVNANSAMFSKWEELRTDSYLTELQIEAYRDMHKIFVNSSFVFLISIFEGTLNRICDIFSDPLKLSPKNINEQSYAMKAKLFLSKVANIEMPEEDKWRLFRKYSEIRNAIVHENARVNKIRGKSDSGQGDRYKALIEFKGYLEIIEDDDVAIFYIKNIRFIEDASEFLQTFLVEIVSNALKHDN